MREILYLCEGAGERKLIEALGYRPKLDKRRGGKDKLAGWLIDQIGPQLKSEPVRACILTDLDSGETLSTVLSRFTTPLQHCLRECGVHEIPDMKFLGGHAHIRTWYLGGQVDMKIALCFPHPDAARDEPVTLETPLMELVRLPAVRDALVAEVLRRHPTWTLNGSSLMALVDEQLPQLLQGAGRFPLPENPKEQPAWLMAVLAHHPSLKFPEVVFDAAEQASMGMVGRHFSPLREAIAWLEA